MTDEKYCYYCNDKTKAHKVSYTHGLQQWRLLPEKEN